MVGDSVMGAVHRIFGESGQGILHIGDNDRQRDGRQSVGGEVAVGDIHSGGQRGGVFRILRSVREGVVDFRAVVIRDGNYIHAQPAVGDIGIAGIFHRGGDIVEYGG